MKKAFLNWSSGKDAAFALYKLQQQKEFGIERLVTTIESETERVSMHGLRKELLVKQANSLEIPLQFIPLSGTTSTEEYNETMRKETASIAAEGFEISIFGDIFLKDLKDYREKQLSEVGMKAIFPLWKINTSVLINEILNAGFKAITMCVNSRVLDKCFCGRIIDEQFLADLPHGVDPCGENGEFHSFVFDGPNFRSPVTFQKGELRHISYRKEEDEDLTEKQKTWDTDFWYMDLLEDQRA